MEMKNYLLATLTVALFSCGNDERIKGDVLFADQAFEESIVAYNEYIALHPVHVKSIYNRGRAYEELGDFKNAFKDFTAVLEIDKKNTSALLSLAKYYYREANFEKSKYFASSAVKFNEQLPQAQFWMGRAQHQLGLFAEALISYNNAINLDRNFGDAYLYRGAIKMQGDRKKSACADFKKAKDLDVKEAAGALLKYCK